MKLNLWVLIIFICTTPFPSKGKSFEDAIIGIKNHFKVKAREEKSYQLKMKGIGLGSWGDPVLKLAAKSFPIKSFSNNKTPMTGIEIVISQKIPLNSKRSLIELSLRESSEALKYESHLVGRNLMKEFWFILISWKRLEEEEKIIKENLNWNNKILKVSEKLYSNGKISQQSLLELKIRISELEILHENKIMEIKELSGPFEYLTGFSVRDFNSASIPWRIVEKKGGSLQDPNELRLKKSLESSKRLEDFQRKSRLPDLTVSLGYTFRSNIDNNGDFIRFGLSLPLPTSDKRNSNLEAATFNKNSKRKELENYRNWKNGNLKKLSLEVEKIQKELKILSEKTLKFGENARAIASKSYGLGRLSYQQLLQAELKLQDLLLKKIALESMFLKKKVEIKELTGESLNG